MSLCELYPYSYPTVNRNIDIPQKLWYKKGRLEGIPMTFEEQLRSFVPFNEQEEKDKIAAEKAAEAA